MMISGTSAVDHVNKATKYKLVYRSSLIIKVIIMIISNSYTNESVKT